MQIPAASSVNSLNQQDIRSKQPAVKPAGTTSPPAARPATDADGDNDGSRIGTQLNVTA